MGSSSSTSKKQKSVKNVIQATHINTNNSSSNKEPAIREENKAPEKTATANQQFGTTNQKSASVGHMDRWQEADLSELLQGLSLDDNADVWKDTVEQLVSRYDPKIEPEKKVLYIHFMSVIALKCTDNFLEVDFFESCK